MKHPHLLCALASLLMATSVGATDTSADLVVKGAITPGAACTVTLGGGSLSLGTIKRDMLNADPSKPTDLEEKRVTTTVGCAHPTRFAFVVREAGGSDPSDEKAFPMRAENGVESAGNLFLRFDADSTMIDQTVQGYPTGADGMDNLEHASWGPSTPLIENLPITNGRYAVGFVKAEGSTEAPGYIKDLSVKLLVRPRVKPVDQLDLSGNIGFSSDLGLEISYF